MKSFRPSLFGVLAACVLASTLSSCATAPTAKQQIEINVLVTAAVSVAVQNGTSDAATWTERANKIVAVATELKKVSPDSLTSVANTVRVVAPLLDAAHLSPGERLLANQLVVALAPLVEQKIAPDDPRVISATQVLDAVIVAASVYIPNS